MRELLKYMKDDNYHGGEVIIDHCENEKDAEIIKDIWLNILMLKMIRPMRALCSFYAEEGGIMVGFHE